MKTTKEFYNDIRAKYELKSNYSVAKIMGCPESTASRWRDGKNVFDEKYSLIVAELLDLNPAYVLACTSAEHAKDSEAKTSWLNIVGMLEQAKKSLSTQAA